jgi:uncharacterized membrane protein YbhN (UPF0104 family)
MTESRYLVAPTGQPRARRATDAAGLALGLIIFLLAWWAWSRVVDVIVAAAEIVDWGPDWLSGANSLVFGLCAFYAIAVIIGVAVKWRIASGALRDIVLALAGAAILGTVLARLITDEWPRVLPELGLADPLAQFPILRVVAISSVLLVAAPHLTRPLRRFNWFVIFLAGASGVLLGFGLPSSAIGAVALGAAAAELVLLILGSPRGYPDTAGIESAANDLGVVVSNLQLSVDQSWGVRRFVGDSQDNGRILIKAYGRDAKDSQFFARAWRYVWFKDTQPSLALSRMQSVEHEALVMVLAARTDASVTHLLAAGTGGDDIAILAVETSGEPLSGLDATSITDSDLNAIWTSIAHLHAAGISNGGLNGSSILVSDHGHEIGDFSSGSLAASESVIAVDAVELLFALSGMVGVERSVASARAGLGDEALHATLPYVQVPAVSSRSKSESVEKPKNVIKEIRAEIERVLSIEDKDEEEPVQLKRVPLRSLLSTGFTIFAAYFLITQLAGIDFVAVWDVAKDAVWALVVIAFVVGQTVYFPQATAMLAAAGVPIPLKPAVVLQSSTMFISLAVPSSAGRIAATVTFLKKYGMDYTKAVVQGTIDTLAGLLVEVTVLGLAFLVGGLTLDLDPSGVRWGLVIVIIAVIGLVVVYLIRHVKKLHDWAMPILSSAWSALAGVLTNPKRTMALLGSEIGSRVVLGAAMWFILRSLDVPLSLAQATTATIAAGLLGGVVPVPGGVGVTEAVLSGFLVLFGVDETVAFTAAVIYRFATFYIPSAAGYFSTRWLSSNGYI